MNKSPINILQEFMIKEGHIPKYSYTLDVPDFKCEVTCKHLSAIGIGTNKKEAKHNAALNMLSLLNITIYPKECNTHSNIQSLKTLTCNVSTSYSNNQSNDANISSPLNTQMHPECNYVGLLQELCIQYRLDIPLYELVNESGPDHMKIFKIKCSIESLEVTGTAHCKKSAKQEAAKNILQLLVVSNILPQETYETIKNYKKMFQKNNLQDITISMSELKFIEPILPVVSEITDISERAPTTYMESNPKNGTIHNIAVDDDSTYNNNTIKNIHTNIYQTKSIGTVNNHELTLENNTKASDMERSIVQSTFTKSLENSQSDSIWSNSNDTKEQNFLVTNDRAHLSSSVLMNNNKGHKRTIEDDLREFNIEILDQVETNKSTLPLTELSKKALSVYLASQAREDTVGCGSTNIYLTDSHHLFKKLYFNKISDDLKKKMYFVSGLNNYKLDIIQETCQDIERELKVKLKYINCSNYRTGVIIICLRMLSTPTIAQFGIGPTEQDAKAQAMFTIIKTIVEYLK